MISWKSWRFIPIRTWGGKSLCIRDIRLPLGKNRTALAAQDGLIVGPEAVLRLLLHNEGDEGVLVRALRAANKRGPSRRDENT